MGSRSSRNSALASGTTRSWRPLMIVTGVVICGSSSASSGSSSGTGERSASTRRSGRRRSSPGSRRGCRRHSAGDLVHRGLDDGARVHPAVLLEVGVEHPRLQRLAELERDGGSAGADDHAREPLRMRRRREQRGRGPDIGRDEVRPAQVGLGDEPARKAPIARGDRRSSRRSDAPNPGRSMANRRACSASVAHIGANA